VAGGYRSPQEPSASTDTMEASMWDHQRYTRAFLITARVALFLVLAAVASSAHAGDGKWSLRLEPIFMDVYGHDQHVLTIHEITSSSDTRSALSLEADVDLTIRGEIQYTWKQWGLGVDFLWFSAAQLAESHRAADGSIEEIVFAAPDRSFSSVDPGQLLFYEVLEDTDIAAWTVDLYAMRTLAEKPESGIQLQLGIRFADFDNDYRAVVGVEGTAGTRYDASSNYDLMIGPLVGVAGYVELGKSQIEGYLGQSVVLGQVELTSMMRDFTGSFSEEPDPAFHVQESFSLIQDVAIPITELRLSWTYRFSRYLAAGIGANASAWWDLPVPPGAIPSAGSDALDESTLVFFGMLAAVEVRF
jgi:hypothetical protein